MRLRKEQDRAAGKDNNRKPHREGWVWGGVTGLISHPWGSLRSSESSGFGSHNQVWLPGSQPELWIDTYQRRPEPFPLQRMRLSAGRRTMGSPRWLAFYTLIFTLTTAGADLRRHKREWEWKSFFLTEEISEVPHQIGKLSSNKSNANTKYEIEGDGAHTVFVVNQQGDIFVHKKLDRETKSEYKLKAKLIHMMTKEVVDREEEFVIKITDINDNIPVFPSNYKGSVEERSPQGTTVLTVTATDADDPTTENGKVAYSLQNGTDLFKINANGVITTKVDSLDREKQNMYVVVVQAKDMPRMLAGNFATTTVTISITDVNDNMAGFKKKHFNFDVKEDEKKDFKIGTMEIEDKDEEQNKNPVFIIESEVFQIVTNQRKDGVLVLKEGLDFEAKNKYTFTVYIREETLREPADNQYESINTRVDVVVNVLDVNEPPVFSQQMYNFSLLEDVSIGTRVGKVTARDPDAAQLNIRYTISDQNSPVNINEKTGDMKLQTMLDREKVRSHSFHVTAEEIAPEGVALKSHVMVNLEVLDVNDNPPFIAEKDLFLCENDRPGTVIGKVVATDKDDHKSVFSFSLAQPSANFSLSDNRDNTANISVLQGDFDANSAKEYTLKVLVVDGGSPPLSTTETLTIHVCKCSEGSVKQCRSAQVSGSTTFFALVAIILCIITILVIVILIVLRKRYQKEALMTLGKNSGEIHEQLVTYDEEGGGEMDTNGYDVSVLTSARNDGSLAPIPTMYAVVKKPTAARGDMAAMIDVKKDEADHDRDGIPYDTLHIYGYEGPESLPGSLSSLDTSSDDSNLDYDFLNDWGPRFKTLAQLYGVEGSYDGYGY
ncbi:cadherin-5 [Arapaima gigas]